tara:strand:- start:76 stop:375 length:300 start_codon:yes stop_codon:yes gene_type:complete
VKAELFNFRCWVDLADSKILKKTFDSILTDVEFEVLGFLEHHFTPQGYTSMWLLGESHLAIHTYPEHKKSYVELTSCSEEKNILFEKYVHDNFNLVEKI